jgi:glutamate 5-kinase
MDRLARVISDIRNRGIDVVLVSSGAIAVGTDRLGLPRRPRDTIGKQAASAVGQATLMQMYEKLFEEYNQKVAQILLTKPVFEADSKKNNARNTISRLLEMGVIPIVNENDTVSTDELNDFSDNDTLSSYVAALIKTDLLIILSDIDGMYTADPNKNSDAEIISVVPEVNNDVYALAGGSASALGTGGMVTKVKAADFLTKKGINMVIASGEKPDILFDILDGEAIGTLFLGKPRY